MKKIMILLMIFIIGLSSIFSGCIQSGIGTLKLQITDDPSLLNITRADVTISSVMVHKADFGSDDNDSDSNESDAGWFTIVNESQTYDLIQLINVTNIIGIQDLNVGWYTQIRLVVERALVTIDGIEYDLEIPSKKVKLISPFEIVANNTLILTLDFDVHESIHETGNGKYIMNPTIKVIKE
jgi:hypothetical protein